MGYPGDDKIRVGGELGEDRGEEGIEQIEPPLGKPCEQAVGHWFAGPLQARQFPRQAQDKCGQAPVGKGLAVEKLEKGRQPGKVFCHRFAEEHRPGVDRRIDRPPLGQQRGEGGDADILGPQVAVGECVGKRRRVDQRFGLRRLSGRRRTTKPRRDDPRVRCLPRDRHRPADDDRANSVGIEALPERGAGPVGGGGGA